MVVPKQFLLPLEPNLPNSITLLPRCPLLWSFVTKDTIVNQLHPPAQSV